MSLWIIDLYNAGEYALLLSWIFYAVMTRHEET